VLLAGLVILALVVPRKLARRSKILSREGLNETDRLKRSMEELLVQLQEVSREMNATLDTKMIALNELIREAESKIEELKEMLERERGAKATRDEQREEATGSRTATSGESGRRRELEETVLRLAGEGKTELEIAQHTGIPPGEIDLVLALRRKGSPPGSFSK